VACQNHQPKILIQACTNINSENQKREISGLVEAMDFFSLAEGYIITIDQEDAISFEMKKISLIPGWKWFCSDE
jgi:uncharacterized protein